MIYNSKWLAEKYKSGEEIKFLFFWGHQPAKDGTITKSCFSQWWESPFDVDGICYSTAEHWMMAGKAGLFGDEQMQAQILQSATPAEAKKLGRLINGFDAAVWDAVKLDVVVAGNYQKFTQHPELRDFLINTNNRILVDASQVDGIWGIGMAADHSDINNPISWERREPAWLCAHGGA